MRKHSPKSAQILVKTVRKGENLLKHVLVRTTGGGRCWIYYHHGLILYIKLQWNGFPVRSNAMQGDPAGSYCILHCNVSGSSVVQFP